MGQLNIQSCYSQEITIISNVFLDEYMLEANGEFVKIYLYLLRASSKDSESFSLSSVADTLNCTEKDIIRALNYWKKSGILELDFDETKKLKGIHFSTIPKRVDAAQTPKEVPVVAAQADTPAAPSVVTELPAQKTTLTPNKIKKLKENEDIVQLLFIASQYLGKTLTPTETNHILYFYDELHFSADLIEYLIEYCVSKGTRSIRYIETVALAWAEQSITTVQMAKKETSTFHKHYFTILKALGIKGRNPIEAETTFMDTWMNEYGFSLDIIAEACTRTVMQTNQPSFQYADGILTRWKNKSVKHLSDIEALDNQHKQQKADKTASPAKEQTPAVSGSKNKFNNFHQRDYDYTELEKQLLSK